MKFVPYNPEDPAYKSETADEKRAYWRRPEDLAIFDAAAALLEGFSFTRPEAERLLKQWWEDSGREGAPTRTAKHIWLSVWRYKSL